MKQLHKTHKFHLTKRTYNKAEATTHELRERGSTCNTATGKGEITRFGSDVFSSGQDCIHDREPTTVLHDRWINNAVMALHDERLSDAREVDGYVAA